MYKAQTTFIDVGIKAPSIPQDKILDRLDPIRNQISNEKKYIINTIPESKVVDLGYKSGIKKIENKFLISTMVF